MEVEFIQTGSRYKAKKEYPWATKIAKVYYGFCCFESVEDYRIFKN